MQQIFCEMSKAFNDDKNSNMSIETKKDYNNNRNYNQINPIADKSIHKFYSKNFIKYFLGKESVYDIKMFDHIKDCCYCKHIIKEKMKNNKTYEHFSTINNNNNSNDNNGKQNNYNHDLELNNIQFTSKNSLKNGFDLEEYNMGNTSNITNNTYNEKDTKYIIFIIILGLIIIILIDFFVRLGRKSSGL